MLRLIKTVKVRSGDPIRLARNQAFGNVKLFGDTSTVKRVEIYSKGRPVTSLRSQFYDFNEVLPLMQTETDNFAWFPHSLDSKPIIVIYTEDELERRHWVTADIYNIGKVQPGRYLTHNYLALSDEDIKETLRFGGPTVSLAVRLYGKDAPVSIKLGNAELPCTKNELGVWTIDFQTPVDLSNVPATIVCDTDGGARVIQRRL